MNLTDLANYAASRPNQQFLWVVPVLYRDRDIRDLIHISELPFDAEVRVTSHNIRFANGSQIQFVRSESSSICGFSADGIVLHDLANLPLSDLYDVLYPTIVARDGWIVGKYIRESLMDDPIELDVIIRHPALKPFMDEFRPRT